MKTRYTFIVLETKIVDLRVYVYGGILPVDDIRLGDAIRQYETHFQWYALTEAPIGVAL